MNILFAFLLFVINTQIIFSQNLRLALSNDDVVIERIKNGYELYIRKKGDIEKTDIFARTDNGAVYSITKEDGTKVEAQKIVRHKILGESFYAFIPFDSSINGSSLNVKDNFYVMIKTSSGNYGRDNNITLRPKVIVNNTPVLSIEGIEDGIDYAALYLLYSGGDSGEYAFYFREGRESTSYKLLPTIWGVNDKDAVATVLRNTYKEGIGKQLLIKVYFEKTRAERYIGLNVFDTSGKAQTSQVEYVLNGYTPIVANNIVDSPVVKDNGIKSIKVNDNSSLERVDNKTNNIANDMILKPSIVKEPIINDNPKTVSSENNNISNFEKTAKFLTKNIELPNYLKSTIIDNSTSLDLVVILDTTMSMDEVMAILKSSIQEISKEVFTHYDYARIGFVLFRDIGSEYVTKVIPYMRDYRDVVSQVKYFSAYGGGDLEEPIYEALDVALTKFEFKSKKKLALIITDTVSKVINSATLQSTSNKAKNLGVEIRMIKTRPNTRNIDDIGKEIFNY